MLRRLSAALFLAISACSSAQTQPPRVTTCELDPPTAALECYDPIQDKKYPLDLSFAQHYTCFPPDSLQSLMTWIRLRAHQ